MAVNAPENWPSDTGAVDANTVVAAAAGAPSSRCHVERTMERARAIIHNDDECNELGKRNKGAARPGRKLARHVIVGRRRGACILKGCVPNARGRKVRRMQAEK